MCVFITIGVPQDTKFILIEEAEHACALYPLAEDDRVRRVFDDSDACFYAQWRGCSCSLYKGEESFDASFEKSRETEDLKFAMQARLKGWSEAKIMRAIQDRMSAGDRRRRTRYMEYDQFCDTIQRLASRTGRVRLYAREYGTREMVTRPIGAGCLDLNIQQFRQRGGGYPLDHLVTIRP
jgi:hypothetical protein